MVEHSESESSNSSRAASGTEPSKHTGTHADKLYLITRDDLPAGAQLAQVAHALTEFALHRREEFQAWARGSNALSVLAVADEAALVALAERATVKGVEVSSFREEDLDHELTALCLGNSDAARRLCGSIGLAGRASRQVAG